MKKFLFLSIFCAAFASSDFDKNNSLIKFYGKSENQINIVIKDNIDIEGEVTSAGSLALEMNIAAENAFIVQKLMDADFHIAGKANLSEWANFRSEESVSGWSSFGGQTTHFLNEKYNPCGSSSGSAVAVSSGLVDIAIGTETNGSISCPSSVNGIVGFKPTLGLVSRHGIIPISSSQDTAGPMGISVELVAITLEAIAGYDPNDRATENIPINFNFNFSENLKKNSIEGKRFAILQSDTKNVIAQSLLNDLKYILERNGAVLVEIDDQREYPGKAEYFLLKYEFKFGLEKYLAQASEKKKTLQEIIIFNSENQETVMPYFGQDILKASIESSEDEEQYKQSVEMVNDVKEETINLFEKYNLDAMIGLTRGPAWLINYEGGDSAAINRSKSFGNGGYAAISGLPHLTIPFFSVEGFPVGVSFIGPPWSDKDILEIGSFMESKSPNQSIVIDVRSLEEVKLGIVQDAIHIEWENIIDGVNELHINNNQSISLYCRSGNRSEKAKDILESAGYTNIINLGGIYEASEKLNKNIIKYSE